MPKNKEQSLDDTMQFIDDKSTPNLMSKTEQLEYYRSIKSELDIRLEELE